MPITHKINILYIDGGAGFTVGLLLLLLLDRISSLYNLPVSVVMFLGVANVCYGLYGITIAASRFKNSASISLLAIANGCWMVICTLLVLYHLKTASLIGLSFLSLEAIFVGFLAWFEWENRYALSEVCAAEP
ncbi:hypothetical protein CS022_16860 [Veronia nyctiphanis]|uniref:Uncharacterized protein n=1 Tax=Veronia nyctiphanis TaxID=1278244 RepID=A0A4Q0YMV5_9GAMM|nr:hypothetical protein [Veronia nyctiphanis]RXJ72220.1 hypothetical protein CS022_16860 [Veronia nyctiphanis]